MPVEQSSIGSDAGLGRLLARLQPCSARLAWCIGRVRTWPTRTLSSTAIAVMATAPAANVTARYLNSSVWPCAHDHGLPWQHPTTEAYEKNKNRMHDHNALSKEEVRA